MAELMQDEGVDAVLAGNMGGEAKAALLSLGIVPVAGFCGPADLAADLLVLGKLPINGGEGDSGRGGGCSGLRRLLRLRPECDCGGCGCVRRAAARERSPRKFGLIQR